MTSELTDAVAALIATLPEQAGLLEVDQLDAIINLHRRIGAAGLDALDAQNAVVATAQSRGCTSTEPVFGYLTADERTAFVALGRRSLDAQRAAHAIDAWEERAGMAQFMATVPVTSPTVFEDDDGMIVYEIHPEAA